jgi:hypothetical protein
MRVVFAERAISREKPEEAIIDDRWIRDAATEMGRVFLHLEMKLVRR